MLSPRSESFLAHVAADPARKRTTEYAYRNDLTQFEAWLDESGIDAKCADGEVAAEYLDALAAVGRRPSSVRRAASAIRGLHKFHGTASLPRARVRANSKSVFTQGHFNSALTQREIQWLLHAVSRDTAAGRRDFALITLMYGLGMRITEVVSLETSQVSLRARLLRPIGKYGVPRVLPLEGAVMDVLADWLGPRGRALLLRERHCAAQSNAVFLNRAGEQISRQSVWRIVRQAAFRAGLTARFSPHSIRDSCARHMLDGGASSAEVNALLGHTTGVGQPRNTLESVDRLRAVLRASHPLGVK